MLHTKFEGNQPGGSEEDSFKVFTIYGHCDHLGQGDLEHLRNFQSTNARRLNIKLN